MAHEMQPGPAATVCAEKHIQTSVAVKGRTAFLLTSLPPFINVLLDDLVTKLHRVRLCLGVGLLNAVCL